MLLRTKLCNWLFRNKKSKVHRILCSNINVEYFLISSILWHFSSSWELVFFRHYRLTFIFSIHILLYCFTEHLYCLGNIIEIFFSHVSQKAFFFDEIICLILIVCLSHQKQLSLISFNDICFLKQYNSKLLFPSHLIFHKGSINPS